MGKRYQNHNNRQESHSKDMDKEYVEEDIIEEEQHQQSGVNVLESLETLFSLEDIEWDHFATMLDAVSQLTRMKPTVHDARMFSTFSYLTSSGLSQLSKFAVKASQYMEDKRTNGSSHVSVKDEQLIVKITKYFESEYPTMLVETFRYLFENVYGSVQVKPSIRKETTAALAKLILQGITDSMLEEMDSSDLADGFVIMNMINDALSNILYQDSLGYLLVLTAAFLQRIGPTQQVKHVKPLINTIFAHRDAPSFHKSFVFKEELDACICSAIHFMGLSQFASMVALNIEVSPKNPTAPRRPYVLALVAKALSMSFPQNSQWLLPQNRVFGRHTLRWFISVMLPLAKRMFAKSAEFHTKESLIEAKLYQTLGMQVWDVLPLICAHLPPDVPTVFVELAPYLGKMLQTEPAELYPNLPSEMDLRRLVCESLTSLIEGYSAVSKLQVDETAEHDPDAGWKNAHIQNAQSGLDSIRSFSTQFLAVLCNNYTTVDVSFLEKHKASRGQALQVIHERSIQFYERVIKSLLTIAAPSAISDYFLNLLKTLLVSGGDQQESADVKLAPTIRDMERLRLYAIFDLSLILLPFLPEESKVTTEGSPLLVFYQIHLQQLSKSSDATVLKKAYKGLNEIIDMIGFDAVSIQECIQVLLDSKVVSNSTGSPRRHRMIFLDKVVQALSGDAETVLSAFPLMLPEVMLATKEANEKTRDAAYACLVTMAQVMDSFESEDTTLCLDADESVQEERRRPSLKEFIIMLVAGFAGSTTHMQSAAVSSLGRVLFDYADKLDKELIQEMLRTVLMVMESENREVIKAALGFIKVCVLAVDQTYLEDQLEDIILGILKHSRNHRSHFRVKVRHLFERLIRRFSFEAVEGFVPESDKNLMKNIRKRRERQKRQQAQQKMGGSSSQVNDMETARSGKMSFEKALHESDSDLSDDDEDDEMDQGFLADAFSNGKKSKQISEAEPQLYEEEGEVVDFLDNNVISKLSLSSGSSKSKPVASHPPKKGKPGFKTNDEGRFIFEDEEEQPNAAVVGESSKEGFDYYKASLTNELAFSRLPSGRVKFLNSKKRGRDEDDDEEDATAAADEVKGAKRQGPGTRWGQRNKKQKEMDKDSMNRMLGRQYKAKRAKGDVKRSDMPDPFAFIPLRGQVVGNMHKSTRLDGTLKNILKAAQKGTDMAKAASRGRHKGLSKGNKKHK